MALIVEDGTGLATAESYISVADADTYIANFKGAVSVWDSATEASKEIAARNATQYLDDGYLFIGGKETSAQALQWPREYAYDEADELIEGVPQKLKDATAELMYEYIVGGDLVSNLSTTDYLKRKKTDVLEKEWFQGAPKQNVYVRVNRLISAITYSSNRAMRS